MRSKIAQIRKCSGFIHKEMERERKGREREMGAEREGGGVILVRNANISEELRLREVMLQL